MTAQGVSRLQRGLSRARAVVGQVRERVQPQAQTPPAPPTAEEEGQAERELLARHMHPAFISHLRARQLTLRSALAAIRQGATLEALAREAHYAGELRSGASNPAPTAAAAQPQAPSTPSRRFRPQQRRHGPRVVVQPESAATRSHTDEVLAAEPWGPMNWRTPCPVGWWDQVLPDGIWAGVAWSVWLINMAATAAGFRSLLPVGTAWTWVGVVVGIVLHLGISKAEVSYWARLVSWYGVILVLAIVVDVVTFLRGLVYAGSEWGFTWLVGETEIPLNVLTWPNAIGAEVAPAWAGRAIVLVIVAIIVAIGSERLRKAMTEGFKRTWNWRFLPS